MSTAKTITPEQELPSWMVGWLPEKDTLILLRKLRPTLHRTTLVRMRNRQEIEATKFAGVWFYKPETSLPKPE
jgi:hypothetical protein